MNHYSKLLIFTFISLSTSSFGQNKPIYVKVDLTNLEDKIQKIKHIQSEVIDSLILIVQNKNKKISNKNRRNAIFLLGKVKNEKSINFLLKNINIHLIKGHTLSDDEQAQEWPYYYILKKEYKNDLALIPFIFEHVKNESDQKKVNFYSGLLYYISGESLAKSIVENYSFRQLTKIQEKNILNFKNRFK